MQKTKSKRKLTEVQSRRLQKAVKILSGHHARVRFNLSSAQLAAMARRGQGDPSQWYNAVNWNAWSPQYPKGNKQRKSKDGDKEKKADVVPGAYDSMPWEPSSQPSSSQQSSDEQAKAFMEAFMKFTKEQDQAIPPALQPFFQQDSKEELKDQQKKLNQHRAILQKIENKKKAIRRDEEQWQHWILEIRETIKKQKIRHEEQAEKLQAELAVLVKKESELKTGVGENETSPIQVEDVEEILDACLSKQPPKQKENEKTEKMLQGEFNQKLQDMKQQLEEDYQKKFEAACSHANQSMQQQLQQHLAFQMMHMANPAEMGISQPPGLPALGTEGLNSAGDPPAIVGPFSRRSQPKERDAQSPYARPAATMQERLQKTHGTTSGGAG